MMMGQSAEKSKGGYLATRCLVQFILWCTCFAMLPNSYLPLVWESITIEVVTNYIQPTLPRIWI